MRTRSGLVCGTRRRGSCFGGVRDVHDGDRHVEMEMRGSETGAWYAHGVMSTRIAWLVGDCRRHARMLGDRNREPR